MVIKSKIEAFVQGDPFWREANPSTHLHLKLDEGCAHICKVHIIDWNLLPRTQLTKNNMKKVVKVFQDYTTSDLRYSS